MNYRVQSKRIRPNAKSCIWCKNFNILQCDFSCDKGLTKRQLLKCIREDECRYCKGYKYSKENFKTWKREREGFFHLTSLI